MSTKNANNMIFKLGELFCGPGGLASAATTADKRIIKECINFRDPSPTI